MPGVTDTDFFNKADINRSKAVRDKEATAKSRNAAEDGYRALMNRDNKVVSGIKNKIQTALSNIIPDASLAHSINELQKICPKIRWDLDLSLTPRLLF